MSNPEKPIKPRPIQFTPASSRERREMEIFAELKGFKTASALAHFATVNYMTRTGYTAAQQARVEELLKEP